MESNKRLQKINRFVQKEINELLRLQTQRMRQAVIVSATIVKINSDLSVAKVFLSIFPSDKAAEIMQNIEQNKNTFRYDLGLRIGKQIKRIPELDFFTDNSFHYMENIDHLLNCKE